MVLSTASLYRYELPLTTPLRLDDETWACRRGLLVRLSTDRGAVGWGEAAPLPGFSTESLKDVLVHARTVVPEWTGTILPETGEALERVWPAAPRGADAPASFRFMTESAVVDLLASAAGVPPTEVLGRGRSTVRLNALLSNPLTNGPAQARQCREQGYQAVKVKVGRASIASEIDALRQIRHVLGEGIALRADANRAWSLEEAVHFAEATRELNLAYVEEPLATPERLSALTARTDLRVALDETTREAEPAMLGGEVNVAAVVLKPTLLGLRAARAWGRAATDHDAVPVLSAAYESGVGLRMLVALAAVGPDVPVGLSTYDRLAADVLRPPLALRGPSADVPSTVQASPAVDNECLTHLETYSA